MSCEFPINSCCRMHMHKDPSCRVWAPLSCVHTHTHTLFFTQAQQKYWIFFSVSEWPADSSHCLSFTIWITFNTLDRDREDKMTQWGTRIRWYFSFKINDFFSPLPFWVTYESVCASSRPLKPNGFQGNRRKEYGCNTNASQNEEDIDMLNIEHNSNGRRPSMTYHTSCLNYLSVFILNTNK